MSTANRVKIDIERRTNGLVITVRGREARSVEEWGFHEPDAHFFSDKETDGTIGRHIRQLMIGVKPLEFCAPAAGLYPSLAEDCKFSARAAQENIFQDFVTYCIEAIKGEAKRGNNHHKSKFPEVIDCEEYYKRFEEIFQKLGFLVSKHTSENQEISFSLYW